MNTSHSPSLGSVMLLQVDISNRKALDDVALSRDGIDLVPALSFVLVLLRPSLSPVVVQGNTNQLDAGCRSQEKKDERR